VIGVFVTVLPCEEEEMKNSNLLSPLMSWSLAFCCLFLACKGKRSSDENDSNSGSKGEGGKVKTVALGGKTKLSAAQLGLVGKNLNLTEEDIQLIYGQSEADDIVSLKYRLIAATLCGVQDGSRGDACNDRPLKLFQETNPSPTEYEKFVPGSSQVASFTDWVDFMKAGEVAKKMGSVTYTEGNIGKYTSVIVNFYRTYLVNSKVKMSSGETIYTKSGGTVLEGSKDFGPLNVTYASSVTNMGTAPSEDAVFFLPNGGKSFYLQQPFEITQKDFEDKVGFKVALAFDPVNFVKANAFTTGGAFGADGWKSGQIDDALGRKIDTSFLEFAPVLAKENETILRETYVLTSAGYKTREGDDSGPIFARLNLYSVKEDISNSIRAVTGAQFYTDSSIRTTSFNILGGIRNIQENASNASYTFLQGLDGKSVGIVKNFQRLAAVGATGAASGEVCLAGFKKEGGCDMALEPINWNYSLVGSAPAESELTMSAELPPVPTASPTPEP
jgi:hypothetical protein